MAADALSPEMLAREWGVPLEAFADAGPHWHFRHFAEAANRWSREHGDGRIVVAYVGESPPAEPQPLPDDPRAELLSIRADAEAFLTRAQPVLLSLLIDPLRRCWSALGRSGVPPALTAELEGWNGSLDQKLFAEAMHGTTSSEGNRVASLIAGACNAGLRWLDVAETSPPRRAEGNSEPSPTGFMGAQQLAEAYGIPTANRAAFMKAVGRLRKTLGDDFQEVAEPRPNAPRYQYRADAAAVKSLAAQYRE